MRMKKIEKILICTVIASSLPALPSIAAESSQNTETQKKTENNETPDAEITSGERVSYDECMNMLSENTLSITDDQILDIVSRTDDDLSLIDEKIPDEAVGKQTKLTVSAFIEEKYKVLHDEVNETEQMVANSASIEAEYIKRSMGSYEVTGVTPVFKVSSVTGNMEDGYDISIDEWLAVQYVDSGITCVCGEAYTYTIHVNTGQNAGNTDAENRSDDGAYVGQYNASDPESGSESDLGGLYITEISGEEENIKELEEEEKEDLSEEYKNKTEEVQNEDVIQGDLIEKYNSPRTYTTSNGKQVSYDVQAAVAYADKWWNGSNPAYTSYVSAGVDCANFTSQCIIAGGLTNFTKTHPYVPNLKSVCSAYGSIITANKNNTFAGNPVFYGSSHAVFCVGRNAAGTPVIDSHTAAAYHKVYNYRSGALTVQIVTYDVTSDGWQQDDGKWYYYKDGAPIKNNWVESGGKKYYMDQNGVMLTSYKLTVGGKNYYIQADGTAAVGWLKIEDSWYYFDDDGVQLTGLQKLKWSGGTSLFYFDSNGKMKTGCLTDGTKKYYFGENGAAVTGFATIKGKTYYFGADGVQLTGWQKIDGNWYYFSSSGSMVTGTKTIGKKNYYIADDGVRQYGIQEVNGKKYYFGTAKEGYMKTGWQQIDGNWYYFSPENGTMQTGLIQVSGKSYYLDSNGVRMSGFQELDGKKFYFSKDKGSMLNGWQQIDGKWYYFGDKKDSSMRTGWQTISRKTYYLNDDGSLRSGWLSEDGRLYYFGESGDKYIDHVMVTGKIVEGIKSPDGTKTADYYLGDEGILVKNQILYKNRAYYSSASDGSLTKIDNVKKGGSKIVITFQFGDETKEKKISSGNTIGSLEKYSKFSEDDLKKVSSDGNVQFIGWVNENGDYISSDTVVTGSCTFLPVFSNGLYKTDSAQMSNADDNGSSDKTEPGSASETGDTGSTETAVSGNTQDTDSESQETEKAESGKTENSEMSSAGKNVNTFDNTTSSETGSLDNNINTSSSGTENTAVPAESEKEPKLSADTGSTTASAESKNKTDKQTYRLSYDLDGGTLAHEIDEYTDGDEFTIDAPEKDGYTFTGWLVNDSKDTVSEYKITADTKGDISLKAVWRKKENNNTGNTENNKDEENGNIEASSVPEAAARGKTETENKSSASAVNEDTVTDAASAASSSGTSENVSASDSSALSGSGSSAAAADNSNGPKNAAAGVTNEAADASETASGVQTGDPFSRGLIIGIIAAAAAAILMVEKKLCSRV